MNKRRVLLTGAAGLIAVAAMVVAGCYLDQQYGHRKGRRCYVKRVVCHTGYGCYYEWHCKRTKPKCDDGKHGGGNGGNGGGGGPLADAAAGPLADARLPGVDGAGGGGDVDAGSGSGSGSGPGCDGQGKCAEGFECVDGSCQACPGGDCPCRSDAVCGADERCNLSTGDCERVPCADLATESGCLARADCLAVYTGQDCTRPDGKECKTGDSNCTCKSFDYSLCTDQPQSAP
jgi:hypothetical protein